MSEPEEATKPVPGQFDMRREAARAYDLQRHRVKTDAKIEKNIGKLLPSLNQDMRLLKEMLDSVDEQEARATPVDLAADWK